MRKHLRWTAAVVASSLFFVTGTAAAHATSDGPEQHPAVTAQTAAEEAITPVYDRFGAVIGYTVDQETRASLDGLAAELETESGSTADDISADAGVMALDWWRVAKCTGSIAAFIALTVFPTARAAKLAVRLGRLAKKYGVKKLAKILTRVTKGKEADAIFKEIAKEALGIGALEVCFK